MSEAGKGDEDIGKECKSQSKHGFGGWCSFRDTQTAPRLSAAFSLRALLLRDLTTKCAKQDRGHVATGNRATVLFPNAEVGSIFRFGRVIALHSVLVAALFAGAVSAATSPVVHLWERQELTFISTRSWANPYTEVTVWVDLVGPGFRKRVYGFWDGERTFRVRLLAPTAGAWTWQSGSNPPDPGLAGKHGGFRAVAWSEKDNQENPLRRGFLRATANHHAIEQADGTPFFMVGDTWYSAGTNRFRWYEDDKHRPLGPEAGFKDYLRYRKDQGYNAVLIIAAFPAWATDDYPVELFMDNPERTCVRSAWTEYGTKSAKNMENEGGRPFLFPGRVPGYENVFPDLDRINPAYFRYLDRKIEYLNEQGFIPIIEVARRDTGQVWKKYYSWPDSYARYIQYVWSRYQANNTVFSPIHFDIDQDTIPASDYNAAVRLVMTKFGPPPYGTLLTANSNPSSLLVSMTRPSPVMLPITPASMESILAG